MRRAGVVGFGLALSSLHSTSSHFNKFVVTTPGSQRISVASKLENTQKQPRPEPSWQQGEIESKRETKSRQQRRDREQEGNQV